MKSRSSNVAVYVRVRGYDKPNHKRRIVNYTIDNESRDMTWRTKPTPSHHNEKPDRDFSFDRIFDVGVNQEHMADTIATTLINHAKEGRNTSCFAYGQTGSGKTYTIFGEAKGPRSGIAPRVIEAIFDTFKPWEESKVAIKVTFFDIHLDSIKDLGMYYLIKSKEGYISEDLEYRNQKSLPIRQNQLNQIQLEGLSEVNLSSVSEGLDIIKTGLRTRQCHEREFGNITSQCHTVLSINITREQSVTSERTSSVINLIDLAGSEIGTVRDGKGLTDTNALGDSFFLLGRVLMGLKSGNMRNIPYANSKLTHILQNSLQGNSHCTLLATINPDLTHFAESLETLKFSNRIQTVVTTEPDECISQNSVSSLQRKVKNLQEEVSRLQGELRRATFKKKPSLAVLTEKSAEEAPEETPRISSLPLQATVSPMLSSYGGPGETMGLGFSPVLSKGTSLATINLGLTMQNAMNPKKLQEDQAKQEAEMKRVMLALKREHTKRLRIERRHFDRKLNRAKMDRDELEGRLAEVERNHLETSNKLRNEVSQLKTDMKEIVEFHKSEILKNAESREEERCALVNKADEITEYYENELLKMRRLYGFEEDFRNVTKQPLTIAEELEREEEVKQRIHQAVSNERLRAARDLEHKLRQMEHNHDHFSRQKIIQTKEFEQEYKALRQETERHSNSLLEEINHLYQYCHVATSIICNMESGMYDIRDKSGIKTFLLPSSLRAKMMLVPQKCKNLRRCIKIGQAFLDKHDLPMAPPESLFGKQKKPDPIPSKPGEAKIPSVAVGQIAQIVQKEKQRLMNELSSDRTVQYIKKIETERDYYLKQMNNLTAKSNSMLNSLKAARRLENTRRSRKSKASLPSKTRGCSTTRSFSIIPASALRKSKAVRKGWQESNDFKASRRSLTTVNNSQIRSARRHHTPSMGQYSAVSSRQPNSARTLSSRTSYSRNALRKATAGSTDFELTPRTVRR
mmetsp:Transcript_1820/g.2501  ORF Transcript_1820/g.2501 Transcript_1820/m.2501 type:complete len:970 (-) Transcript_1820:160-3069(-)